jgi:uncharacterized damage-inducible protein DinB
MLGKDDVGRLLDYTIWANHRVMRAAATLSVDDFKRDMGSSHGGVRGTLAHTMGAEWIWLERWKGVSHTRGIDEGEFPDIVVLRDRWTMIEEHRDFWYQSLKEESLAETIAYRTLDGRDFQGPLWQLVQHMVNHSTYHRGQIVTLLRLLGATVVSTDLVLWDREQQARAAEPDRS